MAQPKLSKLEMTVMEALWSMGPASVREIQEALPGKSAPAYTTVQTIIYRLEKKGAVKRIKKISNAHIFAAAISQTTATSRVVDDLLSLFGGKAQPLMSHLIETGKLTSKDVEEARKIVQKLENDKKG